MSAQHSCVLEYALMTMCSYSKQVQDIKHYGASVGDDFDATMNLFIHFKWFSWSFGRLNTTAQELEII